MTSLDLDVNQRWIMDLAACAIVQNHEDYTDEEVTAAMSYLAGRKNEIMRQANLKRAAVSGLWFTIPFLLGIATWALIMWGIL